MHTFLTVLLIQQARFWGLYGFHICSYCHWRVNTNTHRPTVSVPYGSANCCEGCSIPSFHQPLKSLLNNSYLPSPPSPSPAQNPNGKPVWGGRGVRKCDPSQGWKGRPVGPIQGEWMGGGGVSHSSHCIYHDMCTVQCKFVGITFRQMQCPFEQKIQPKRPQRIVSRENLLSGL